MVNQVRARRNRQHVDVAGLNPAAYGELLARVQPRPITDERDYDRLVAEAGRLVERGEQNLSAEEISLLEMISILIEEYDRKHYPLSPSEPHRVLAFLLEQRGLEPHDLWTVLGSKSRVSEILSGKRAVSKAHAKKLAEFFHVPVDLFIYASANQPHVTPDRNYLARPR